MTIDDYSHYIWTLFLGAKEDALDKFRILGRSLEKPTCALIQANHGNRFEHRVQFGEFCEQHGISHNFSDISPPQTNEVVQRKDKKLQVMCREFSRAIHFAKVLVSCLRNHVLHFTLGKYLTLMSYDTLRSRKSSLEYLRKFKDECFILKTIGRE